MITDSKTSKNKSRFGRNVFLMAAQPAHFCDKRFSSVIVDQRAANIIVLKHTKNLIDRQIACTRATSIHILKFGTQMLMVVTSLHVLSPLTCLKNRGFWSKTLELICESWVWSRWSRPLQKLSYEKIILEWSYNRCIESIEIHAVLYSLVTYTLGHTPVRFTRKQNVVIWLTPLCDVIDEYYSDQ